jgi:hypothetical protein
MKHRKNTSDHLVLLRIAHVTTRRQAKTMFEQLFIHAAPMIWRALVQGLPTLTLWARILADFEG